MDRPRMPGRGAVAGLIAIVLVAAACSAGATSQPAVSDLAITATASPSSTASVPAQTPGSAAASPDASPSPAPTAQPATPAPPKTTPRPTPKPTPKPTKSPPPAPSLVIRTQSTSLGTVLASSDHLTLYFHAGDGTNHSSCTGTCSSNWPPLVVAASTKVTGGAGITGHFATFKRADGTTQVSYDGHPLYSWPGDVYPGDTTGQGLGGFSVAKP